MIPKGCKRLAEVDFPIAEVSKHAAREKSIRHGHPSTLHLWWARRPLASSRAVLLALLWPDPCDPLCPAAFKAEANNRLREVPSCNPGATDEDLRHALLHFIADFSNWDNAAKRTYLEVSRALVKAAYASPDDSAYEPPLVVDPFAGGGSIPLEALRVGCEAFASDLNPVACLILKVMLEDAPRYGLQLAEELRCVGAEIKREVETDLTDLYPQDADGAVPIAYIWARTVRCESPNCGAEIPLVRSFWLCKKASRMRALRCRVERPKGKPPRVDFEIFEPKAEKEVPGGTVINAKAKCPCCGAVLSSDRVRTQLAAQRGGAHVMFNASGQRTGGARLVAIVVLTPGESGRRHRVPTDRDYAAVLKAQKRILDVLQAWESGGKQGLCPIPDEQINPIRPSPNARGLSAVTRYGATKFSDLYCARQALYLHILSTKIAARNSHGYSRALALLLGKQADYASAQVTWVPSGEFVRNAFPRQALSMTWDFAEAAPFADASGNLLGSLDWIARVVEANCAIRAGQVEQADAAAHPLPSRTAAVWFTDPPYYDAVPYADLSDYFLVWLRRAVGTNANALGLTYEGELAPKEREIVWNAAHRFAGQPKSARFFEEAIGRAFMDGRRVLGDQGIAGIVFAHQSTEGWEAMIGGMIRGGWTVTASWPIATERTARTRAMNNASLATSVHLVCRPRPDDAGVGDWAGVLRELPTRVADWMERLQHEGVRGADLVFACIGPALEIFSRYTKVEIAEGDEVKLDKYLSKVWEVVGRSALAQVLGTAEAKARNGAAGAVEEDARLTALFLWTLQATDGEVAEDAGDEEDAEDEDDGVGSGGKAKGFTLVFDVVRRFAQPLGIELSKWEGRVIEMKKGVVRLLPVAERAKQLFGEDGASAVASRLEQTAALGTNPLQGMLFPEMEATPKVRGARGRGRRARVEVSDERLAAAREATTLDRVHAAMLLQAGGRTNALRALLKAEQDRGPDFLRLANALSALYPKSSEEKRLLDAMLLAVPR
jgi:putative DNA methylase